MAHTDTTPTTSASADGTQSLVTDRQSEERNKRALDYSPEDAGAALDNAEKKQKHIDTANDLEEQLLQVALRRLG